MLVPKPTSPSFLLRLLGLARENPDQVRWLAAVVGIFLLIYFLPAGTARFDNAVLEGIRLTHWYAQEHVILCLLPAFFIAGAIAVFVSQASVMKYLGARANKYSPIGVASVSGHDAGRLFLHRAAALSRASTRWAPDWVRPRPSSTPARPSTSWRSC
jgi:uncharacterized protein